MTRGLLICLGSQTLLLGIAHEAGATLIINSWGLQVAVQNFEPNGGQSVAGFDLVQPSPWLAQHEAVLGASWAAAQYDFTYGGDAAVFHIDTQQYCLRVAGELPSCISSGHILVTPAVDSAATYNAFFTYNLPAAPVTARLYGYVRRVDATEPVIFGSQIVHTLVDPPQGTMNIDGQGVLLAGITYRIQYLLDISHGNGVPVGSITTGFGSVHVTLTPIPEPAALGLLTFAALPLTCRRGRCCAPHHRSR